MSTEGKNLRDMMTDLAEMSASLSDWADWLTGAGADDTADYFRELADGAEKAAELIARKIAEAG